MRFQGENTVIPFGNTPIITDVGKMGVVHNSTRFYKFLIFEEYSGIMNLRKKSVDRHVAIGDYFGTLATILSLQAQEEAKAGHRKSQKRLEGLVQDLVYLQANYRITSFDDGRFLE